MPIPNPPAIIEPAQEQSPLLSELVKRAAQSTPLQDTASPMAQQPVSKSSAKWPMLAALAGDVADTASTNWSLHQPGSHEINPLLSDNPMKNTLGQAATDAGILYLIHKLNKNHPTMAKLLGYGDAAWGAGGTAFTMAHTHKPQPPVFIKTPTR